MSFVVVHPEHGVFLGVGMGMAFWSKLDSVGQDCATAFLTEDEARSFIRNVLPDLCAEVTFVPVVADRKGYASVSACVQAGLPGWLHEAISCANTLPI